MDTKKIVKEQYSKIAKQTASSCGCSCSNKTVSKTIGYTDKQLQEVGEADLGLGCGNPVAFSNIKEGNTVLDLGSGAGIDCFLAAKKVGPKGKVIGIDFTKEMITKAKANALKVGHNNVDFMLADIDSLPVEDDSIDIIISNCVINLAPDKNKVFREAFRVLKPNGKIYVSDIVLLEELSEEQRRDKDLIAGCVGGALLRDVYINIAKDAGFRVKILNENKSISKDQYHGIPLESLLLEGTK
ncbi:arsenite methyltransferase [Patescibacteria group bacterium]|nr:arsenite methyltransferase [Patescibacteria group bacterium]MBU1890663.1 arsenite methyltransferase [Patescibacteria group bacterium]